MKKLSCILAAALLAVGLVFSPAVAIADETVDEAQTTEASAASGTVTMYRLYNKYSGEHLYTKDQNERTNLVKAGWKDEGVAWIAPAKSDTPVRRMYNCYTGDHHYTTSRDEVKTLIHAGWIYEGICWYSADASTGVPLYRAYNKYVSVGTHLYTTSKTELQALVKAGWADEGIAWYGVKQ